MVHSLKFRNGLNLVTEVLTVENITFQKVLHKCTRWGCERLAPPDGFEPSTNWLTARRSTGLSYGGSDLVEH